MNEFVRYRRCFFCFHSIERTFSMDTKNIVFLKYRIKFVFIEFEHCFFFCCKWNGNVSGTIFEYRFVFEYVRRLFLSLFLFNIFSYFWIHIFVAAIIGVVGYANALKATSLIFGRMPNANKTAAATSTTSTTVATSDADSLNDDEVNNLFFYFYCVFVCLFTLLLLSLLLLLSFHSCVLLKFERKIQWKRRNTLAK